MVGRSRQKIAHSTEMKMPDEYYTLKGFNKRIIERLKPKKPITPVKQRLQGLRVMFQTGVGRFRRPRIK